MSRQTDVRCDAVGCGLMDSPEGHDWITLKLGKRKYDFCSEECLGKWHKARPKQARLEGVA